MEDDQYIQDLESTVEGDRSCNHKHMVERSVLKSELPQIHRQICLYHVMRTFSREISIEKLGITSGEKQTVLELLQKIAYATSSDDYDAQYQHLLSVMPPTSCLLL